MLFLSIGGAKADTVFDVSGPVTGQVTINTTTGALVSGDIKVPDFTNIVAFQTPPELFAFAHVHRLPGYSGGMALTFLITSCNVTNPISCIAALLIPDPFAPPPFPAQRHSSSLSPASSWYCSAGAGRTGRRRLLQADRPRHIGWDIPFFPLWLHSAAPSRREGWED